MSTADSDSKVLCNFGHFLTPMKSWTVHSQQELMAPKPRPATTQPMENRSWLSDAANTENRTIMINTVSKLNGKLINQCF